MTEATIFATALDKYDPAERSAYLESACAGDADLRRRVEELLATHEEAGDYLERPAVEQMTGSAGLDFLHPSDRPGSIGRFADYEVQEVLGRSPFGAVVLKAFDPRLHRVVAIKLLTAATNGVTRARFQREARAAAVVCDDHVVAMHAVEDQPVPYLVMEYIAGQTLQQKLDRTGPLELREILRIGTQVARGLIAIHAQGLMHRDIKPANILLENGIERVKITDFGLARPVDITSYTHPGIVAGTPSYMSPEQAQGEPIGQRSDLFSLGSVLYAMCTGKPPFRAADALAVLRRVIDDTPRPVRTVNPDVPAWLSDLIARLHAKNPNDRPQSAREVADLLAQRLAALQMPGAAVTPGPARRPARSRRWLVAAVVLLAVVGLGAAEGTGVTQLSGTVIRLFDPSGTLVIESDDPDVTIAIDGKELIVTGAGPREFRLRPGSHQIEAAQDGLHLDTQKVTIERNGRAIVRVHREPGAAKGLAPAGKAAAAAGGAGTDVKKTTDPQHDLAEWVLSVGGSVRVKYELSPGNPVGRWINPNENLPAAWFSITGINLTGCTKVRDDDLTRVSRPTELTTVRLEYIPITDAGLTHVVQARGLQQLYLRGSAVGDGAIPLLAKLPNLSALDVSDTKITEAGLKHLDELGKVSILALRDLPVTDAVMPHLAELTFLTDLDLTSTKITNAGVVPLAKLEWLQLLSLSKTGLTDAALEPLAKLERLTRLNLDGTRIKGDGLKALASLPLLQELNLAGTPLTDAALEPLAGMRQLRQLNLGHTQVTPSGVAKLRRALPQCQVVNE